MNDIWRARVVMAAAAAPVVAVTVLLALFSLLDSVGRTPLSYGTLRNLAEAAALGNAAEVMRRLDQGDDPSRVVDIGPEFISSAVTRVTALEAMIWGRSGALAHLFDARGAIDDATRRHLVCLARDSSADEVADALAPPDSVSCEAGAAFGVLTARR